MIKGKRVAEETLCINYDLLTTSTEVAAVEVVVAVGVVADIGELAVAAVDSRSVG